MKKTIQRIILIAGCTWSVGCQQADKIGQEETPKDNVSSEKVEDEKPIQHIQVPDITSHEEAVKVMASTTEQLKSKKLLNAVELNEIHMITYTLEKAIAYFADKSSGDQLTKAKKMAELIEEVHLNSENNKAEKTKTALDEYFQLNQTFKSKL